MTDGLFDHSGPDCKCMGFWIYVQSKLGDVKIDSR